MPAAARAWQWGETTVILAARHGKAACVELLLAAGADKEAKDSVVRRARLAARAARGSVDGRAGGLCSRLAFVALARAIPFPSPRPRCSACESASVGGRRVDQR